VGVHAANSWAGSAGRTAMLSALTGAVVFGLLGYVLTPKVGPHRDKDHPESMKDDEFAEHLAYCEEKDHDPFLAWLVASGTEPGEKMAMVSLGLQDQTRKPVFPAEISTSRYLSALQQQARRR
jgi:hypothetical protein